MPDTPDITPSADARELHPDRNPARDYGGRWEVPGSSAIGSTVDAVPVVEPDGPEQLDLFAEPTTTPNHSETTGVPEAIDSPPFTIDTRLIKGEAHLCAIAPDGTIITSRGQGSSGSPELYSLVEKEALRILGEQQ